MALQSLRILFHVHIQMKYSKIFVDFVIEVLISVFQQDLCYQFYTI